MKLTQVQRSLARLKQEMPRAIFQPLGPVAKDTLPPSPLQVPLGTTLTHASKVVLEN